MYRMNLEFQLINRIIVVFIEVAAQKDPRLDIRFGEQVTLQREMKTTQLAAKIAAWGRDDLQNVTGEK